MPTFSETKTITNSKGHRIQKRIYFTRDEQEAIGFSRFYGGTYYLFMPDVWRVII